MNAANNTKLDYLFIIPTHNEELIIEQTLELLRSYLTQNWQGSQSLWKIVVANNGSTDQTAQIVKNYIQKYPAKIELLEVAEPGRGKALKKAVQIYESEVYMYIDADLPLPLEEIAVMLEPVVNQTADIVVGRRICKRSFLRRCLTWLLRKVNLIFFDLAIHDSQCGVKAFNNLSARTFLSLNEDGFFLDSEFLIAAENNNLKLTELPVHWIDLRYEKRKSKVKFIADSNRAIASLSKIFMRNNKKNLLWLSGLILIGIAQIFIYRYQLAAISPADFLTEGVLWYKYRQLAIFISLSGLAYLIWCLIVYRLKNVAWNFVLSITMVFFIVISAVAILTHPTRSQDVFHSLLLVKNWSVTGVNPYLATPAMVNDPVWSHPVLAWREISMTYGPLWVYILWLATFLKLSLGWSVLIAKFFAFAALLSTGYLVWKIGGLYGFSREKKVKIMSFMALNPILIQNVLVDAHNDVYLMLAITASYYFILKKQYAVSMAALMVGGFVKYLPWYFMPIPLILMIRENKPSVWIRNVSIVAALFLGLFFVGYLPFWHGWQTLRGIFDGIVTVCSFYNTMIGTSIWYIFSQKSFMPILIRAAGLLIGLILMLYFILKKNDSLRAFTWPMLFIFFFATPWFMPWYLIWTMPLLIILYPSSFIILTTLAFWPSGELMPTFISSSIVCVAIVLDKTFVQLIKDLDLGRYFKKLK